MLQKSKLPIFIKALLHVRPTPKPATQIDLVSDLRVSPRFNVQWNSHTA